MDAMDVANVHVREAAESEKPLREFFQADDAGSIPVTRSQRSSDLGPADRSSDKPGTAGG